MNRDTSNIGERALIYEERRQEELEALREVCSDMLAVLNNIACFPITKTGELEDGGIIGHIGCGAVTLAQDAIRAVANRMPLPHPPAKIEEKEEGR